MTKDPDREEPADEDLLRDERLRALGLGGMPSGVDDGDGPRAVEPPEEPLPLRARRECLKRGLPFEIGATRHTIVAEPDGWGRRLQKFITQDLLSPGKILLEMKELEVVEVVFPEGSAWVVRPTWDRGILAHEMFRLVDAPLAGSFGLRRRLLGSCWVGDGTAEGEDLARRATRRRLGGRTLSCLRWVASDESVYSDLRWAVQVAPVSASRCICVVQTAPQTRRRWLGLDWFRDLATQVEDFVNSRPGTAPPAGTILFPSLSWTVLGSLGRIGRLPGTDAGEGGPEGE